MTDICDLDDHRPHISLPTLDGNVQVLPCLLIERIIDGKVKIEDCEDFDIVLRTIISEWYKTLC